MVAVKASTLIVHNLKCCAHNFNSAKLDFNEIKKRLKIIGATMLMTVPVDELYLFLIINHFKNVQRYSTYTLW